jgi:putative membrane protein
MAVICREDDQLRETAMMRWYGTGMGGWGYLLGAGTMLLFWSLAIFGVVLLVRTAGSAVRPVPDVRQTAQRALDERYARGEIDEEEYQRRLRVLHDAAMR